MKRSLAVHRVRPPQRPQLFDAVGEQRIGTSFCFLCGIDLTSHNRSDEHVFPKWLLHHCSIWKHNINLLNGTSIPYRQLTIPACKPCNSQHLARVEQGIRSASMRGPSGLARISQKRLFLWLGKILYGLLYKEGLLLSDRSNPKAGPILAPDDLQTFRMHHWFLQAARLPLRFVQFFPASIFVFRLKSPTNSSERFWFRDAPGALALCMRIDNIGILASLQDGGAQRSLHGDYLNRIRRMTLDTLQFGEVTAQFFYKASLFNRTPKYLILENARTLDVVQMPLQGMSSKPVFDEWDQRAYAAVLADFTGAPFSLIYRPPDRVMTWLRQTSGSKSTRRIQKATLRGRSL